MLSLFTTRVSAPQRSPESHPSFMPTTKLLRQLTSSLPYVLRKCWCKGSE